MNGDPYEGQLTSPGLNGPVKLTIADDALDLDTGQGRSTLPYADIRSLSMQDDDVQVTAAGPGTEAVKATPGKVARIRVITNGITATPMDGAAAAWDALTDAAELDLGGTPMQFTTDIGLAFSAAGSAWILYK